MRLHRFYINQPLGEEIVHVDNQVLIHQMLNVFRYTTGSEVILFSGDSFDYRYSILSSSKKEVSFALKGKTSSINIDKKVVLYMALIKKDTFEHVVRTTTELGVTHFVPVIAERSEKKNLNMERLAVIAQEASEQCGRGDVPIISQIITLEEAIQSVSGNDTVVVASLFGRKINDPAVSSVFKNKNISIFIGPEGGWSEKEEEIFTEKGFTKIKLTDTVLKADTGTITAVSTVILG